MEDSNSSSARVTGLLERAAAGDEQAEARLFDILYADLHACARRMMRSQSPGHTLQATALLNEAFLRVRRGERLHWENRAHFIGVAVRAMRSALVDHARAKATAKRGGDRQRVALDGVEIGHEHRDVDVIDLHEALERLAELDPEAALVVELRFFGGLDCADAARTIGISTRTAARHWEVSRAWLHKELS